MNDEQKNLANEAALQREIRDAATDNDTRILAGIMAELAEEKASAIAYDQRRH